MNDLQTLRLISEIGLVVGAITVGSFLALIAYIAHFAGRAASALERIADSLKEPRP